MGAFSAPLALITLPTGGFEIFEYSTLDPRGTLIERMRRVDTRVEYGVRAYDGYSEYDAGQYDKNDLAAIKHEKTFAER